MKSTVVDESLSSTQQLFCSREDQLATINPTEWEIYTNYQCIPPGVYDEVKMHIQEVLDVGTIWPFQ